MLRNNQKHASLQNDDTLETMLSFNYDQPIKEEVIFEDSDDEETRQLEMYIKQELCDENIHSENILKVGLTRSLTPKLEVPENHEDNLKRNECSVSEKKGKPLIHEKQPLNTECRIGTNVENVINNVVAFSFEQIDEVISSSVKENHTYKPTSQGEEPELHRLEDLIKDTATAFEINQKTASGPKWPVQTSCTSLPESKMPNSNAISTSSEDKSLKKNGPPSYARALYTRLLQTIIEHLYMILPALNDYVTSNNHTDEYRLSLKTRFEAVKYQYFSFCYSTVKTIILPQRENKDFLNNFKKHFKIYADKRGMSTSDHNINLLCDELVCWAEVQKNKITFQEILSTKNLKQQPQNISNRSTELQTLLEQQWQPPPAKRNRPCPIPVTCDSRCMNEARLKNIRENINNVMHATNGQTQSLPSYSYAEQRLQNCAKGVIQYQKYQDNHTPRRDETVYFAPATQPAGNFNSEGLQSHVQMCQNTGRNCITNTHQRINPLQHHGSHEPPPICAQERSISRDSGYLSPVGQQVLQNEYPASAVPEETQENRFPVIVEVTSMQKPNASKPNHQGGYCRTCNKNTNLLCMGCNLVYYCSTECQGLHWRIHKFYCRSY